MTTSTRPAFTGHFYRDEPTWVDQDGSCHWVTRGANFMVVATRAKPGSVISRTAGQQSDEYFLLLPEQTPAEISAGAQAVQSEGDTLTILPPGESRVVLPDGGWAYRVFSRQAEDLAALAQNHAIYAHGCADVADLATWPEPVGGYQLRHYSLPEHARSDTTMRLFRTRHLMINVFLPGKAPRDIGKMTPHTHDDFEQGSLAVHGGYIHHLRYPWTVNMREWREDEHVAASAPSLCVIPPKVIHTSQSIGEQGMQLVDIFAPPREDFSVRPGLVCNADEYPLPAHLQEKAAAAADKA